MVNRLNETSPAEKFVIENNIIKGAHHQFSDDFQVGKLLFDTLSNKPDHVSQIEAETGKKTTFAEMKDRSVRCALWLKKQGIGRNDVVAVRIDNNVNAYIPIFASFFLGATYNALNHLLSFEQIQELMKTVQPKVLFISGSVTEMVVQAARIANNNIKIVVLEDGQDFQSLNSILQDQNDDEVTNFRPENITNSEDVAYIILSSGTTALPKPMVHSYANLYKQIFMDSLVMKNLILWYSPTYWITGILWLLQSICFYKFRIIHTKFDPEETSKVIEKYKVDQLIITSPALNLFCQSNVLKKYQLKSLKLTFIVGSKPNRRMLKVFHKCLPHVSVRQALGTSETGTALVVQTENSKNIYSTGYVIPGVDLKIRDLQTNEALGSNAIGEICVKVCTLMKGYLKNEKATKEAIDAEGWLHTGDAAYYNEDGEIFIVDRITDAINYKNIQIWPSEIEDILMDRDDIFEAAVVSIPHEIDGERPIAFVKRAPDSNVTEEELRKYLESLGENRKWLVGVKFINELPRLAEGKIVRRKLIELAKSL